ncbi:hypothetical protein [Archangium violaceum]|uniref:Uncharacterized protein n=1 Tax=Archangium violaceum Cb vi76 TaxID=1406225 RepID=A0A084SNK2_9BACT|nr:hypothetical protein [Archangium violaceum]KFA90037.1 hypothetical protein Q664_31165 [Archangium violaceum Cb vi76]
MTHTQPQYLLFTSLVKHGELLRYLLAAQVRKRLLEPYGIYRQVKSSALTGNPDRVFEIYYVDEHYQPIETLEYLLSKDPAFQACHRLIEDVRIHSLLTENQLTPNNKRSSDDKLSSRQVSSQEVPPPLQTLTQLDYLFTLKSQQYYAQARAKDPYLLQVTCTLISDQYLDEFNACMKVLLETFAESGLNLLVAGQYAKAVELLPTPGRNEPQPEPTSPPPHLNLECLGVRGPRQPQATDVTAR